jgi:FAD/FMN-containing dehydrogenase
MTTNTGVPMLPPLLPASRACIDDLEQALGPASVWLDEPRRRQASTDYAWLSPVLTEDLPDVIADVVVLPRTVDELARVVSIAFEHGVAVTGRGRGTGNYGQAVPLAAGMVVDTTRLDRVIDIEPGWIHAEAGVPFTRLETAARATGQELAMFPSTTNSVLGGFLCGGAGGTGTVEHGFLWEGFVDSVEVVPCWDAAVASTYSGSEVRAHLHAYGTTGVVSSARVMLVPARRWTALFASFDDYESATAAGQLVMEVDPIPRNVAIDDPGLVACFPSHPSMPLHRWSLRVILEESTVHDVRALVTDHGGRVDGVHLDATALLTSLSYNHATLRAKRAQPETCHVQIGGPALISAHAAVRDALPDALVHLDGQNRGGRHIFGGLLMSRWVDRDTLYGGMDALRALGVFVVDPHTWLLGAHGGLDEVREAANHHDPKGLLNPGKLPAPVAV